jgi:hypothetical protein
MRPALTLMPAKIPATIIDEIFQSWLCGVFRHPNAIKHGVSDATVSNVVAERRRRHGPELMDHLRALSLSMSRSGLSFWECAVGPRIAMILRNMGAVEEQFEGFIQMFWELYTKAGLAPAQLINEIEELYYFRQTNQIMNRGPVSIPKICEDIKMKQAESKGLDMKCTLIRESISDLLHQKGAIEADLEFDKELKEKLQAKGLQSKAILEVADLAAFVKESGYSIEEVRQRFAHFVELDNACALINDKVQRAGIKHDQLLRDNESLEEVKSKSSQRLRELELLEIKGFGLPEFKMLHNLINEIAEQRGMPTDHNAAVRMFFDDLRINFYNYLNLAKELDQLKLEIRTVKENRNVVINAMNLCQESVKVSELLAHKGFKKEDLERIGSFIVQNFTPSTPTTTTAATITSSAIKSITTNKNSANQNDAPKVVTANEVESRKGLDPSAIHGKSELTQKAKMNRNLPKEGSANGIVDLGTSSSNSNERQLSESTSRDWKKNIPKCEKHENMVNHYPFYGGTPAYRPKTLRAPSIKLRHPRQSSVKKLETNLSATQANERPPVESDNGLQNFSVTSLVDDAVLYPIARQLDARS